MNLGVGWETSQPLGIQEVLGIFLVFVVCQTTWPVYEGYTEWCWGAVRSNWGQLYARHVYWCRFFSPGLIAYSWRWKSEENVIKVNVYIIWPCSKNHLDPSRLLIDLATANKKIMNLEKILVTFQIEFIQIIPN